MVAALPVGERDKFMESRQDQAIRLQAAWETLTGENFDTNPATDIVTYGDALPHISREALLAIVKNLMNENS